MQGTGHESESESYPFCYGFQVPAHQCWVCPEIVTRPLDGRLRDRPTAAQECKLPVCQHCRKLGNHSAGGQHDIFQDLAIVRNPYAASMN